MPGFAGFSLSDEILNFIYRDVEIEIGLSLWMRLLVAPSSRSGGGTETNYSGYTRLEIVRGTSPFGSASSNGQLTNTAQIVYPVPASVGNGDLVAFDIVDTSSGAFTKLYNGGPIVSPKSVVVGKAPTFRIGGLLLTF